jgi:hypothetical protein
MKGLKYDGLDGEHPMKNRWDLLPIDCIEEVVKILTFGSQKYGDNSWQEIENANERYYAALMRHLAASRMGEKTDPESGLSHLSHVMCNVVFLLWLEKHTKEISINRGRTIKVKENDFITPYIYRYTLGNKAEREDGSYIVYHNGERKKVTHNVIEFSSEKQLTKGEFQNIISNTKDIIEFNGKFKD